MGVESSLSAPERRATRATRAAYLREYVGVGLEVQQDLDDISATARRGLVEWRPALGVLLVDGVRSEVHGESLYTDGVALLDGLEHRMLEVLVLGQDTTLVGQGTYALIHAT